MRLERINPDRNEFRFYEVTIEPTLFGEHALLIRWGRIGKPSRQRIAETGPVRLVAKTQQSIAAQKARGGYREVEVARKGSRSTL